LPPSPAYFAAATRYRRAATLFSFAIFAIDIFSSSFHFHFIFIFRFSLLHYFQGLFLRFLFTGLTFRIISSI
jgi:hypothetical protein